MGRLATAAPGDSREPFPAHNNCSVCNELILGGMYDGETGVIEWECSKGHVTRLENFRLG